jgi:polyferredoxin
VLVYAAILASVTAALAAALVMRVPLKVDVIRDRGALAREVDSGQVENVYRLQVSNTTERVQRYTIGAQGLPSLEVASDRVFEVAPATTRSVPLRLRAAEEAVGAGSHAIVVEVVAQDDAAIRAREKTTFLGLRR